MNSLDLQLQLSAAKTLTTSVTLDYAYDQKTAVAHLENQLDQVGLFIPFGTFAASGTETYQFQVVDDSVATLATTPHVVADTGTMSNTDSRLVSHTHLFLPIPFNTVLQEFVGCKYISANSASIVIYGAWLAPLSAMQNFRSFPINYSTHP